MQNSNFLCTLGNPRKIRKLKARYLRPWAKIHKSARLNCWHGLGVKFGAYFVGLASKPREEIGLEIGPPEALGPKPRVLGFPK
jgi:hypothetical protein